MKFGLKGMFCRLTAAFSWGYLVILFAWLVAYLATGDRYGYLALVNLVAVYLFFLLPVILMAAFLCRSRGLAAGFTVGLVAFLWLWGGLFLPRLSSAQAAGPTLKVMTYNVLATHRFTDPVLANIDAEDPDIVLLQELNQTLAQALQTRLGEEYPYQLLQPVNNATGIGIISRFPIRPTGEHLPHRWIGGPIVATMEWNSETITLVDFHMFSTTGLASQPVVERGFRFREEQARLLVDLASRSGPVIMGGDANAVPLNTTYRIISRALHDSWREAGFGLGHTFPGESTLPGSDRPRIGSFYVPVRLARIDYIFHSSEWETISARVVSTDGVSDHRAVVAVLRRR